MNSRLPPWNMNTRIFVQNVQLLANNSHVTNHSFRFLTSSFQRKEKKHFPNPMNISVGWWHRRMVDGVCWLLACCMATIKVIYKCGKNKTENPKLFMKWKLKFNSELCSMPTKTLSKRNGKFSIEKLRNEMFQNCVTMMLTISNLKIWKIKGADKKPLPPMSRFNDLFTYFEIQMHITQASGLSAQRMFCLCYWWKWFIFIYSILCTFFIFVSIPFSVFNFKWFCVLCAMQICIAENRSAHFLYFDWTKMNGENRFNQCHFVFCMWIEFYFRRIFSIWKC